MSATFHSAPRLNCELLESRDNPSGNVSVFVSGGMIFMFGDAANNRINLSQDSFGNNVVVGLDGTTVNGQSALFLGQGAPSTVYIDMGAGNDRTEVVNFAVSGNLFVNGNTGDDQTVIAGVAANGGIILLGGDGNDNTFTSRTASAYLIADGGNGVDAIHVDNAATNMGVWGFNNEIGF